MRGNRQGHPINFGGPDRRPGAALDLMAFTSGDELESFAQVAMGHVGLREFRRAVISRYPVGVLDRCEIRYEYAVFRDDESIVFNERPDAVGAKPITVAYFGARPDQP